MTMPHGRRSSTAARTAALAAALGLLGLSFVVPTQAQQTAQSQPPLDLVAFKGVQTLMTPAATAVVPVDPPVMVSAGGVFKGESALFGPYTALQHFTIHLGADGNPLFQIGEAVWTGTNGDALSFGPIVVLILPPTTPGVVPLLGAYTIRSGRGRFLGATGSGIVRGEVNMNTGAATLTIEGLVTRPK
jgi:hypothetical protein